MTTLTTTPALSPAVLPDGRGKGAITNLILTDGARFYCADEGCEYVADSFASVRSHRNAHRAGPPRERRRVGAPDLLAQAAELAAELVATIEALAGERDEALARAVEAERRLAKVRRSIARGDV